ncbi:MAG: S-layer homology domain-containing protein, partial [Oscillospiraceae bacterium]|nr:S-layer homology domain-containing protein [Oscillospiraceae bacterium]
TNGTAATTFSPDDGCTRAQFATFLYRLAGEPELQGTENPFSDVKNSGADAVYYNAILWAYENGIIIGTSATTFTPGDAITREDAVTMLYRCATLINGGTAPAAGSSNPFSDVVNDETHAYSYNAILWAYGQGITTGTSSTTFSPGDTCERAMMVTFLYRFVNSASYLSAAGSVSAVSETVDAAVGAETDAVSEEDSAVSRGEAAAAEDGEIEEADAVSEEESAGGEEADAVSEGQEEPLLEE